MLGIKKMVLAASFLALAGSAKSQTHSNELHWLASSTIGVRYVVEKSPSASGPFNQLTVTNGLTYTDTPMVAGSTNYYQVRATCVGGNCPADISGISAPTAVLALLTPGAPPPPPPAATYNFSPIAPLTFSWVSGGANPAAKAITVRDNDPSASHTYTVSTSANWLTATPGSGNTTGTVSVGINTAAITANGTYTGNVILTSSNLGNSPLNVVVTLTVTGVTPPPPPPPPPSGRSVNCNGTVPATGPFTMNCQ